MDSRFLLEQAQISAGHAVQADRTGEYYPASLLYLEAYELIDKAIRLDPSIEPTCRPTANSYLARAEALRQIMATTDRERISVLQPCMVCLSFLLTGGGRTPVSRQQVGWLSNHETVCYVFVHVSICG